MTISRPLSEEECHKRLREAIVNGTYLPNQRLVEMDLATDLNANRAAIRTALARLEQEGLVERERYRGARVRLVSEEEAIEILEAREALEGVIARYAAQRATEADIRNLRQIIETMRQNYEANDLLRYSETNSLLHQKIREMARHATVTKLLDTLNSQNVRFQFRTVLATGRPEKSFSEHQAIVDAIAKRDAEAAEAAMRHHLANVTEALRHIK